eukprot:TRINITY_DN20563_c0_g1_i1.p1 TRINITY_DN20563_c0_g1~~TRINITY_DN20563_c0_g1_i1.p1  ORF type:complete len:340 (-),score=7.97 TRINITY_DN20563_c0_g1_i1:363-1382(-)
MATISGESSLLCGEVAWDDEVASSSFDDENLNTDSEEVVSPDLAFIDEAAVHLMIQMEGDHLPRQDYVERYRNRLLDATARRDAISWILKVQAQYNFRPLTVYLSINYLDRFLSSYEIPQGPSWLLQLLSVSCLSLAVKMEEIEVPSISDLQVDDTKPLFEVRTIRRMELLVMSQLQWRLRSITPFNFIDYYLYRLEANKRMSRALVSLATGLVVNTVRVVDFLEHKPSAVAGAAVLCAVDELLPQEAANFKQLILSSSTMDSKSITDCYNLMQELLIDVCATPHKSVSNPMPPSPVGVLDAAVCVSCDSTECTDGSLRMAKRRRLHYEPLPCMAEGHG